MFMHLARAHYFFCRKSQHYMLGNWWKFEPWSREKINFTLRFPWAYVKFMRMAVLDGLRGHRYGPYY